MNGVMAMDSLAMQTVNGGVDISAILRQTLGMGIIVVRASATAGESAGEMPGLK